MPKQELIKPEMGKLGFTCPHCNFNSQHTWGKDAFFKSHPSFVGADGIVHYTMCQHCEKYTIWYNGEMIYPDIIQVDDPNEDMPASVKSDYIEAAKIVEKSPRAAAALLRLAIEKLCNELGESGKIDSMIGSLVRKGLPNSVQRSLDIVRVIGNEGVHAGQIDLKDDKETVYKLFKLVNFICDKMITEQRYINENFDALPENKKQGIEYRDKS
jgi:Domain of unknown function (DUF4145)